MTDFFGADRKIGAFRVFKGVNDTIWYNPGGGSPDTSVTIEPGDYWAYTGSTVGFTATSAVLLRQIYSAISTAIGSVVNIDINNTILSPTGGVSVFMSSGVTILLSLMHESWRPLFGVLPNDFVTNITDGFESTYSMGTHVVIGGCTRSKFYDEEHEQYHAGDPVCEYSYRWGTKKKRHMIYNEVPSGLVRETRASESDQWAAYAGLAPGDTNTHWKGVWDSWSRGSYGIIVHNDGHLDFDVDTHEDWEIVRLARGNRARFTSTLPDVELRGEFYTLDYTLDILRSEYNHK